MDGILLKTNGFRFGHFSSRFQSPVSVLHPPVVLIHLEECKVRDDRSTGPTITEVHFWLHDSRLITLRVSQCFYRVGERICETKSACVLATPSSFLCCLVVIFRPRTLRKSSSREK